MRVSRKAKDMKAAKPVGLSKSEEGYVETIHSLVRAHGYARVADIAASLRVKPPSVTNMLQKLDEQKFVTYTRYRGVVLTRKGRALAGALEMRHRSLKKFLILIGVSETNAEEDACQIEHIANRETVEKLADFVEFIESAPRTPPFLEHFKYYGRTGKRPKQCRTTSEANRKPPQARSNKDTYKS